MKKLNIGIVCYPSYGGSGVVATDLGLALAKRGHSIHFISYEIPFRLSEFDENIQFHEVNVQSYPLFKYPPYSLALASKMVEVCEAYNLDILHVHYAIPHSICAYLAKQILKEQNVKIVTTLHGTDITLVGLDKSYYRMVQFGILESDQITTVSHFLKDITAKEFKIDNKIHVVPNFVNTQKFSPKKRKPKYHFVKKNEKIIMHASNFRPIKNIDIVIKTFFLIQKKVNACLILIGDGPEIIKARQLASELGIIEKMSFLGRVERIEDVLPCADLFLLPSHLESFGLVLLEAMSCGVPTISSNVGGIPEVVQHGKTGFVFPPNDHESMAEKAIEILTQPDLKNSLGKNGRIVAEKSFSLNKIVDQYKTLYFETLNL